MTEFLYKTGIIIAISSLLVVVLNNMPDAEPLPDAVADGINWVISTLYFFNDILDIPTFMIVMYRAVQGFILYLFLVIIRIVIRWSISVT